MRNLHRLFPLGLLWKEWKGNIGYLLGGVCVMFLVYLLPLIEAPNQASPYLTDLIERFRQPGFFSGEGLLVLVYTAFLVCGDRKQGAYDLLLSMPYSRRQIIASKYVVGLVTIIAVFLLIGLLLRIIFLYYPLLQGGLDGAEISRWIFRNILVGGLLFSFTFMFGTLTGTVAAAAISSAVFLFYPIVIAQFIVRSLSGIPIGARDWILRFGGEISLVTYMNNMDLVLARWLPILFAGAIFFLLAMVLFEHNPMERNGKVFIFKKLGLPFAVALAPAVLMLAMWWLELRGH